MTERPDRASGAVPRVWRIPLLIVGGSTVALALYHFWLPVQWGWSGLEGSVPPAIFWAIHALNFFYSALLLGGGTGVLLAAGRDPRRGIWPRRIAGFMAGYWLVHAGYLVARPFPMPREFRWASLAFTIFPLTLAALLLLALIAASRGSRGAGREPVPDPGPR